MDWARHAMANFLLAKPLEAAAIEVGPAGLGLTLETGEVQLSFAGPGFIVKCGEHKYSGPVRFVLKAGQVLDIVPRPGAMWGYLGIQGVIDVPSLLGSYSENSVSGLYAIKLVNDSHIPVRESKLTKPAVQSYVDPYIAYENQPISIFPSSQFDNFSLQMQERLVSEPLSIAPRFDRMAYQLSGVLLSCDKGHDILSDGVTTGAIQVPGNGRPYILMADHQTTGGYPKIACVCKADMPRLAQMTPGQYFTLRWITPELGLKRWASIKQQIVSMTALRGM